jgi:hypothetical protein
MNGDEKPMAWRYVFVTFPITALGKLLEEHPDSTNLGIGHNTFSF